MKIIEPYFEILHMAEEEEVYHLPVLFEAQFEKYQKDIKDIKAGGSL